MNKKSFFKDIEGAKKTSRLTLAEQIITDEMWSEILKLSSLKYLCLLACNLGQVPDNLNTLKNLKELIISSLEGEDNDKILKTFPVNFTKITQLEKLTVSGKLVELPIEFQNLKELREVNLSNNKFQNIPQILAKNSKLTSINLFENDIQALKFVYVFLEGDAYLEFFDKLSSSHIFSNFNGLEEVKYLYPFVFLKSKSNYAFIEGIEYVHEDLAKYQNGHGQIVYNHHDYYDKYGNGSAYIIRVFGEEATQKQFLFDIRLHLEKWFKISNLHLASRLFLYPLSKEKDTIINYNTLLKYQQGEKYSYFDDDLGKGFSVEDLLNYINIEESLKEKQEWKIKGHITNVQIKNLRLFEDISFNLSPNINIVLGHNGLGKTSILQGITIALLPIENIDKSDDFTRKIRFNNKRAEVAIDYAENEQRVIHILPSGLFDINQVGTPPHILLSYGVNLNADTKISPEFIEILIKGNSKLYATKSIFKPYSNDFNDPLLVLYELERESKLNPECRKLIDLIVDKINDYLKLAPEGEKMKLVEEKGFYYFKDFNQNNLQLHHLSEGYKDHILLITDIFLRIIASRRSWASGNTEFVSSTIFEEAKGVILIDEFDRHLHPVWQRRLLFELKNDFPNIQFILTTHNVFSLQSAVGANAIQLVVKEGKIKVETKTIERKNILGIIDEFYTEEFFDYEAQQELSLFSKYLDRIHEGDVDFVYSDEFKGLIKKMYDMGDEIRTSIASQLLHLNSTLKKLNKKEFEL